MLFVFSHGRGLNSNSKDMVYLSRLVKAAGHDVHRVDDRDCDNPQERLQRLKDYLSAFPQEEFVLVGFSMGAYCSLMAANEFKNQTKGLFLIAPPLYFAPKYPENSYPKITNTVLVHGWNDEVIPVENALRYGKESECKIVIVKAKHLFKSNEDLEILSNEFTTFLKNIN